MRSSRAIEVFLQSNADVVEVLIQQVQGHAPRAAGTIMYVAQDAICGTIGGGQLEYMAIDRARKMLVTSDGFADMDVPLGPEIGQCCGGRVQLSFKRLNPAENRIAQWTAARAPQDYPAVYLFGAGHVGRALADFLQHLPVRCVLVDNRQTELALSSADVERKLTALPEAEVAGAPSGSAFIVLTHDHALDFMITQQALARGDAAYVGMIGSATKRQVFRKWAAAECNMADISHLTCPIGAQGKGDKRPEVIAAFVVAEVLAALQAETNAARVPAMAGIFKKSE